MILTNFMDGFLAVFRGVYIILSSKRLMLLSILPIVIGLCILVAGSWYVIPKFFLIEGYFLNLLDNWVGAHSQNIFVHAGLFISTIFLIIALLITWAYLVFLLTKLLAGPFYAILAQEVLKKGGLKRPQNLSWIKFLILSFRTTAVNLVEIIIFLIVGAILFVFSFIPFLNVLAGYAFFLVIAFDSTDYSFDVLHFGLGERLKYFFSHFAQFCGFAFAISLVIIVPGLNLILFAASVAGAADLVSRIDRGRIQASDRGSK